MRPLPIFRRCALLEAKLADTFGGLRSVRELLVTNFASVWAVVSNRVLPFGPRGSMVGEGREREGPGGITGVVKSEVENASRTLCILPSAESSPRSHGTQRRHLSRSSADVPMLPASRHAAFSNGLVRAPLVRQGGNRTTIGKLFLQTPFAG
jgi:hypothetical protein